MAINEQDRRHQNPGRPVGTGHDRCITFRLRLNVEERKALDERATEIGMTPSQYLRSKI